MQEIYGLLLGHFVVRTLMQEAAATRGLDPQRLSFTATLKILRCRLPECRTRNPRRWYQQLLSEIVEEVLPARRNRINPRVIKRKMSKWPKNDPCIKTILNPPKPSTRPSLCFIERYWV
nr:hypothetical protein [Gammaproteobacteria bacterium]